MEVNGGKGLVSMVVQNYVEKGVHKHMVVVINNQKDAHHSQWIGMHLGMALAHSMLEEVAAKKVVHKLEAFDSPIHDACSPCSFHSLQHNLN
ncbi:hypothetical protein AHAS_Ahas03G0255500 [Arachis hypogaea]